MTGAVLFDGYDVTPGLGSDRLTLPADGLTAAACHYYTTDPTKVTAQWTVNGLAYSEALVNGVSEIEVTAAVAGSLVVTCNGESITLTGE